jgi:hypothetical protein
MNTTKLAELIMSDLTAEFKIAYDFDGNKRTDFSVLGPQLTIRDNPAFERVVIPPRFGRTSSRLGGRSQSRRTVIRNILRYWLANWHTRPDWRESYETAIVAWRTDDDRVFLSLRKIII